MYFCLNRFSPPESNRVGETTRFSITVTFPRSKPDLDLCPLIPSGGGNLLVQEPEASEPVRRLRHPDVHRGARRDISVPGQSSRPLRHQPTSGGHDEPRQTSRDGSAAVCQQRNSGDPQVSDEQPRAQTLQVVQERPANSRHELFKQEDQV